MKNIRVVPRSIAAVAVNAQTTLQGKFQLANEVRWGKTVLPAGEYSRRVWSATDALSAAKPN